MKKKYFSAVQMDIESFYKESLKKYRDNNFNFMSQKLIINLIKKSKVLN